MEKKTKKHYICEECGFLYDDKSWADKCQDWCSRHNSCNLEITKHAIKVK